MIGIVLAAGEATRLPNKPLLPVGDDVIAIESAMQLCWDAGCDPLYVVQNTSRIVELVLKMRGHQNVSFVTQPAPYGVPDAVTRVPVPADGHALVAFCDNVYPPTDAAAVKRLLTLEPEPANFVSVRVVRDNAEELDAWDAATHRFVSHDGRPAKQMPRIAGWYVLTADACAQGQVNESSVDYLNRVGARGVELPVADWCDIGTAAAYAAYLKRRSLS